MGAQPLPLERAADPERFPSAEELRMIRAIVLLAVGEAARHGHYRASFHGFRVSAQRQAVPSCAGDPVELELCVSLGQRIVQRIRLTLGTPERPVGRITD
jgi:hypothetical protein